MADNFMPMGGIPDFYGTILNSAQQNLVRMPDGSLAPAPQMSPPTSLADIYGGMYAPAGTSGSTALTSHPVKLVAIGRDGNPVTSGSASLRPSTGDLVASSTATGIPHANGTILLDKDQSRLDPGTGLAFAGGRAPSLAEAAIDAATTKRPSMRSGRFFANGALPFLTGDPGEVDWSIADPGMGGLAGYSYGSKSKTAAKAPTQPAPKGKSLLDMLIGFGGAGPIAQPVSHPPISANDAPAGSPIAQNFGSNQGGNGSYAGDLRGTNMGLPASMNSSRWLTGY